MYIQVSPSSPLPPVPTPMQYTCTYTSFSLLVYPYMYMYMYILTCTCLSICVIMRISWYITRTICFTVKLPIIIILVDFFYQIKNWMMIIIPSSDIILKWTQECEQLIKPHLNSYPILYYHQRDNVPLTNGISCNNVSTVI